jgi:hypothetical protein
MRVPRVRFTIWCLMAVVAVVALALGYLRRPYPALTVLCPAEAGPPVHRWEILQHWSDGRVQTIRARCRDDRDPVGTLEASEPWPKRRRHYGPVLAVEWTDGTMSFHLDGQ